MILDCTIVKQELRCTFHFEATFSVNNFQEHLRRILRGQSSLFDWSMSASLARTLSPRVLESQIDAKKVSL